MLVKGKLIVFFSDFASRHLLGDVLLIKFHLPNFCFVAVGCH